MKKKVALITWSGLPEGAESERMLLPHLALELIEPELFLGLAEGAAERLAEAIVRRIK